MTYFETETGAVRGFLGAVNGAHGLMMATEMSVYEWDEQWVNVGRKLSFDSSGERFLAVPRVFAIVDHPDDRRRVFIACTDGVFERAIGAGPQSNWYRVGAPPPGIGDSGTFKEVSTGEMRATPPHRTQNLCWQEIEKADGSLYWALFTGTDTDLYFLTPAGNWMPFELKNARGGGWSQNTRCTAVARINGNDWLVVGSRVGLTFIDKSMSKLQLIEPRLNLGNIARIIFRESDQTLLVLGNYFEGGVEKQALRMFRFRSMTTSRPFDEQFSDVDFFEVPQMAEGQTLDSQQLAIDFAGGFFSSRGENLYALDEAVDGWTLVEKIEGCVITAIRSAEFQDTQVLWIGTDNGNVFYRDAKGGLVHLINGLAAQGPVKYATSAQVALWGVQHVRIHDPDCQPSFDPDGITNKMIAIAGNALLGNEELALLSLGSLFVDLYNRWAVSLPTALPWTNGVSNCWLTFALIPKNAKISQVLFQTRRANGAWAVTSLKEMQADNQKTFIDAWCGWRTDVYQADVPNTDLTIYGYQFKTWTPDICYMSRFTVYYEI